MLQAMGLGVRPARAKIGKRLATRPRSRCEVWVIISLADGHDGAIVLRTENESQAKDLRTLLNDAGFP